MNDKLLWCVKFPSIRCDTDPFITWEVEDHLGGGTFGQVVKVKTAAGQVMAAKICLVEDEEELERFSAEVDIMARLRHRNIVRLYDSCYHRHDLWMFLELSQASLDRVVATLARGLGEQEIVAVCRQMAGAVEYLHNNRIIHRDIKAGNVLVTAEGEVKLTDFGVAAELESFDGRRTEFIGTPHWMAPEVVRCRTFTDATYDRKVRGV